MHLRPSLIYTVAGGLSALACIDNPEPLVPEVGRSPEFALTSQLQFARWGPDGPPAKTLQKSIQVTPGEACELRIGYRGGGWFLRLRLDDATLLDAATLEGSVAPAVVSPLIEVRATVDPNLFIVTVNSDGYKSNPYQPAELRIRFDQVVIPAGASVSRLALWRQELPDTRWVRVSSARIGEYGVETDAVKFGRSDTRYALAIGR